MIVIMTWHYNNADDNNDEMRVCVVILLGLGVSKVLWEGKRAAVLSLCVCLCELCAWDLVRIHPCKYMYVYVYVYVYMYSMCMSTVTVCTCTRCLSNRIFYSPTQSQHVNVEIERGVITTLIFILSLFLFPPISWHNRGIQYLYFVWELRDHVSRVHTFAIHSSQ